MFHSSCITARVASLIFSCWVAPACCVSGFWPQVSEFLRQHKPFWRMGASFRTLSKKVRLAGWFFYCFMESYKCKSQCFDVYHWYSSPCPGGIRLSFAGWERERIVLLCPLVGWSHLQCWGYFWSPQYNKDIKLLGSVQSRAMKIVKGLEGKA